MTSMFACMFEGFNMPTADTDSETASLCKQLLLRPLAVATADQADTVACNTRKLCQLRCGELFPCGRVEHACTQLCLALEHPHKKCVSEVAFYFQDCGHPGVRLCCEEEEDKICMKPVQFQRLKS